jgi:hypothetical protein
MNWLMTFANMTVFLVAITAWCMRCARLVCTNSARYFVPIQSIDPHPYVRISHLLVEKPNLEPSPAFAQRTPRLRGRRAP